MLRYIALIFLSISPITYAGYNLYITKKEFPFDDGECITKQEWEAYLKTDPSIRRDPESPEDTFLISISNQDFSLWYSYDFCDLETKNPTPKQISKMIQISKKLNATVQGDDTEIYITPNRIIRR